ncbi:hypothetical protein ACIBQ1_51665 [Nonomuraea sp. NPDC050153]|uniref:hypothetical protein n=1 Tax=Nonomuraea sp. NPDC050153 TaxID=3364359 RepID=UPI0037A30FD6
MTKKSTVPAGLGPSGAELWEDVTALGPLPPHKLRILLDACREADLVDELEAARVGRPLEVKGSMGQPVAAPLVSELPKHRALLASLLGKLGLPDEVADERPKSSRRSESARAAARARWGSAGVSA